MSLFLAWVLTIAVVLITVMVGGGPLPVYSFPAYGLVALATFFSVFSWRRSTVRAGAFCLLSSLVLAGYVVARALLSPVQYLAVNDLYMMLAALAVYLVFALHLTVPRYRLVLIGGIMLLAMVQMGIGLVQFSEKDNFMLIPFLSRPDYGPRASGFFGCPNHLAGFLEITAVFALSMAVWGRWPAWAKLLSGYVGVALIVGQLITGSRGGYLSLLAGLVVFAGLSLAVVRRAISHRFWHATIASVLLAAFLAAGVAFMISRSDLIRARAAAVADTTNMRVELWGVAYRQFQISPLVGTGSGTFLYYGRLFRPSNIRNDPRFVHNDYLHMLAEYGAAGVGLCLVFIGIHVGAGIRGVRRIAEERMVGTGRVTSDALALTIGAVSAVAALVVHSWFDFNLHMPANTLLMAFVFAVLANPGIDLGEARRGARGLTLLARSLAPVCGVWIAVGALPMLRAEYCAERARRALGQEQYLPAIRYAQDGIVRMKTNPDLYYYLGWSQARYARKNPSPMVAAAIYRSAAESLRKGTELFPQDRRLWIAYAHTLRWLGRFEEAAAAMEQAVKWDPKSASARAQFGLILKEAGRLEEAKEQHRMAASLGGVATTHLDLAEIEKLMKERVKASQQEPIEQDAHRTF